MLPGNQEADLVPCMLEVLKWLMTLAAQRTVAMCIVGVEGGTTTYCRFVGQYRGYVTTEKYNFPVDNSLT